LRDTVKRGTLVQGLGDHSSESKEQQNDNQAYIYIKKEIGSVLNDVENSKCIMEK
jgi:hypothetical protein